MAVEEMEKKKKKKNKGSNEKTETENSDSLSIDDPSPRCVLEIPLTSSDSDNSSSCSSCSPDKSSSPLSTTPPNVSSLQHHGLQWNKMIDSIKKKSIRRFSVIPLLASYELTRKNMRRKQPKLSPSPVDCDQILVAKPSWRNFTYEELVAATDSFNPENMIGKGGHAEVYRGVLPDGETVAIKKLMRHAMEEEERVSDFLSELGMIAHVNHPNAARLRGFSSDRGLHFVLEYAPHGSLASLLFGSEEECLDWKKRYKVALGVADGLRYLHNDCPRRIIHRDIKASNILLSQDYEAQISDFGLAKWLPENCPQHIVFPIEGTFGYLAPEYFMHGVVDEKTDVFAFGVLLLEIITGRRAVDTDSRQSIVMWVKPLLEKSSLEEIVDPKLGNDFDETEMRRVMQTASMCIHHVATMRPDMNRLVQLLRGNDRLAEPHGGGDKVVESDKLLETRSLELTKTLCELDLKLEQLGQVKIDFSAEMEHLKRIQTRNRELEEGIERKRKDLAEVLDKTTECEKVLETRSLKLVSKEKELQELSLDLDLKEEVAKSLDKEMEETCQKTESKAKELEAIERMINERSGHCESVNSLIEEHTEELALKEKRHDEIREATLKLSVEIAFKENTLTERNKQVEEGEKKIQELNNTSEELIRQVFSINEAIRECTCELEAKRKQRDEVQSSITDLTAVLKSAEKKIQESLEDLKSTEEKQVKLKASLSEHEKGVELREKELIAREEKINEQDKKLQLAKQELAKWVEDYEVKAKQLVALTPLDKPIGNSRKRGRHDAESLSQSFDHVLTSCTTGQENTYNFENERSPDKFKIDQIWAVYSDNDKGMPRKYAQIKKIDTSPEFKLHVATLVLYRPPPPNLMPHPVCCGRFKLKIGKAEVLEPSSFSHEVKALKTSVNRFEVYPRKGEVWALYKNWNITDCADGSEEEELEIVEIVETDEQSIQAMLLTAKVFNQVLYGRCLESKAGVLDIPKTEVNRFSHQIPAFRRDRRAARSGDCEWWELDSKAVLDLNSKNP